MASERPMAEASPGVWRIFRIFFTVGITSYGGPAMLPFIRRRVVDTERWLSEESFRQGLAMCQTIPGATLMQLSAYVGLRLRGVAGAAAAYVGFALPAFLLITGLSVAYFRYRQLSLVGSLFDGLQVAVIAIVAQGAWDFLRRYATRTTHRALAAAAAAAFLLGVNPLAAILGAAAVGAWLLPAPILGQDCMHPPAQTLRGLLAVAGAALAALAALRLADPLLFHLALSMFKVDLFAFGGFGAFPILHHEVVDVRGWLDEKTFMDGIALGQVTPGPILLTSSFVGWWLRGPAGSLVAGVAVFIPSFLLLLAAVPFCDRLLTSPAFRAASQGVLATLGGLIAAVGVRLAMGIHWDAPHAALLFAAGLALWRGAGVPWVVLGGALAGLLAM